MYEYSCKIQRIVDGDTCDCVLDLGFSVHHKCRVRLYGIDTPESRTRNRDEKARGLLAKQFLKDSVKKKKIVLKTKLKDSKGKFGRILAEVWADGINVNEDLVKNAHAVYYHGQSKKDVEREHMENRQLLIDKGIFDPSSVKEK
jgi:micrococcal nuclease|tara:strand:- start:508 stop:939 length:432 start_codon:yes stop_codon:yes gene_type:complete